MPPAFWQQDEMAKELGVLKASLGSEVVDIRFNIDRDWDGDPSVFFDIILPDGSAVGDPTLRRTKHVEDDIEARLRPLERGLIPYFRFIMHADDVRRREKAAA